MLMKLQEEGLVEVRDGGPVESLCRSMLWRMLPIWEFPDSIVLTRDIDSISTTRERACVEEWIDSGLAVHGINDEVAHGIPLMGGMAGYRSQKFIELTGYKTWYALVDAQPERTLSYWNTKGADQDLLNNYVWPRVSGSTMVHQLKKSYSCSAASVKNEVPNMTPTGADVSNTIEPYIGYAGFSLDRAKKFLDACCREEINKKVSSSVDMIPMHDSPTRYAIMSITSNKMYAYYAPISSLLWTRMGYTPVILVVGKKDELNQDSALKLCLRACENVGAILHYVDPIEGYSDSTVAQVSRLYSGGISGFWDEDFILTTDVDMFPLSSEFFQKYRVRIGPGDDGVTKFHIWYCNTNGNIPGTNIPSYPICYLSGEYRFWKQIMGLDAGQLQKKLTDDLNANLGKNPDGWTAWNHDEQFFGRCFHRWLEENPSRRNSIEYMPRNGGPPTDRIDRSTWNVGDVINLDGKVDAHMPRNDILVKTYSIVDAVSKKMNDPMIMELVKTYSEEFYKLAGMDRSL